MQLLRGMLLAVAGGLILAYSFPPGAWNRPLAVLGPALLAIAVWRLRAWGALLVAFAFGLAFYLPHVSWSGIYLGPLPWIALSAWQASYLALLGPAFVWIRRLPFWPVWAAMAWVATEALQGRWPFGGFPWARLGFSQDAGPFTPFAAFGGAPLLSFAVALCGLSLAAVWLRWRAGAPVRDRLVAAAVAVAVPLVGLAGWLAVPSGAGEGAPQVVVAVVQGNVPRAGLDFNAQRRAVLDNHVNETLALAERVAAGETPRPAFVLWPENSSDIDPYRNEDAAERIQEAADAIGVPIVVGAVVQGPGEFVSNQAIVWLPESGPSEVYNKRHPVPFAEYMPAREFFRTFTDLVDLLRVEFAAGDRVGTLNIPGDQPIIIGDVICFEVAYDSLVQDVVNDGAQIITVQTNNATFGYSNEPHQQLAMGRIRAIEHGRTVLSASTSGVSAIILPDGSVVADTGLFEANVLVESVPLRTGSTLATRLGAIPEWVMTALGAGAVVAGFVLRRRERTVTGPDPDGTDTASPDVDPKNPDDGPELEPDGPRDDHGDAQQRVEADT